MRSEQIGKHGNLMCFCSCSLKSSLPNSRLFWWSHQSSTNTSAWQGKGFALLRTRNGLTKVQHVRGITTPKTFWEGLKLETLRRFTSPNLETCWNLEVEQKHSKELCWNFNLGPPYQLDLSTPRASSIWQVSSSANFGVALFFAIDEKLKQISVYHGYWYTSSVISATIRKRRWCLAAIIRRIWLTQSWCRKSRGDLWMTPG